MDIRLIPAPISIAFSEDSAESEVFKREFDSLSESDDDAIGQWLKLAKARGETGESDQVMLTLMIELHRKVDQIIAKLDKSEKLPIPLEEMIDIDGINYDYFSIKEPVLESRKRYYGRISMPTFPKRDVAIYFDAVDRQTGMIVMMHHRDRKEWDSYIAARERTMIREMKENNGISSPANSPE